MIRNHSIKHFILAFLLLTFAVNYTVSGQSSESVTVSGLKTEYYTNPVGIDNLNPRLSWIIESGMQNTVQEAWQIQVATSRHSLETGDLIWDTDKINSDVSIHHSYNGPDMQSGQRYYWRVRIWDNHGNVSPWSEVSFWEMGLLKIDD